MVAFSKRCSMASEVNHSEPPFPQFPGAYPGASFSSSGFAFHPSQATQMDSKAGIAAVPIRSVPPLHGPTKNRFVTKPVKIKKNWPPSNDACPSNKSRPKQPKKKPSTTKKTKRPPKIGVNIERKNPDLVYDEAKFDFSRVPPPFCSCTGVARACYKWGSGSWQSSCCNTNLCQYPLPMSPSRPGARVPGRKMSHGAYTKLLCRFATEGRDLSQPIDLKNHWAKHGTNKFVTIK
ncbi:protein BASIC PENTACYSTEINE7-like [Coffea eugenioides]|uniref:protein BASIC PENTACYSTEINE7-like n=1 Tax=Coffea eugenioides TaxID=49369 RepID=UPI000F612181|nr:protein BASIC PENTACYSTEINE7-like [Coffea eugenioides]XP_027183363.1 protein BASIC PENTACYSTEINE7-like [Coffea eugenioides]